MSANLRGAVLAAALPVLAGCSSSSSSGYSQYFELMRQAWKGGFGDTGVTHAQAAAIPYASLGYRVGDGPEMILVLATDSGGEQLWTSGSHVVLMTTAGRVIRTQKLGHDLGTTTAAVGKELQPPSQALEGPFTYQKLTDFPDLGRYGTPITCRASAKRPDVIRILGSSVQTFRVSENCNAPGLNWSFVDSFWMDRQSGFVWRSIQHIHPKLDALTIEIFRPPG